MQVRNIWKPCKSFLGFSLLTQEIAKISDPCIKYWLISRMKWKPTYISVLYLWKRKLYGNDQRGYTFGLYIIDYLLIPYSYEKCHITLKSAKYHQIHIKSIFLELALWWTKALILDLFLCDRRITSHLALKRILWIFLYLENPNS